jgi:hypothetical protein
MRYPPLLIALFLVMLLWPFAQRSSAVVVPTPFFLILVFGTLIYAFRHIRGLAVCLTLLGASAVALRLAGNHWQSPMLGIGSHALSFASMVLVMIAMFSEVLRARTVSTDLVIGAVCLYVVIGLAWTFLYYSIYLLSPGSIFVSPGPALTASVSEAKFTEVFYFSLSALTTIGSSGEEALTPMARQLAVVESAMGQLYLAVLISRLVGFSTTST